jgi:hypothetical protein
VVTIIREELVMQEHNEQEPRTVEEAQEAAREEAATPRVTYLDADEVEKPAPVPLSEEEHGSEPFDGQPVDETEADFEAEETDRKE